MHSVYTLAISFAFPFVPRQVASSCYYTNLLRLFRSERWHQRSQESIWHDNSHREGRERQSERSYAIAHATFAELARRSKQRARDPAKTAPRARLCLHSSHATWWRRYLVLSTDNVCAELHFMLRYNKWDRTWDASLNCFA